MTRNTELSIENALESGMKMKYAMLTYLSKVTLSETPAEISPDELTEARFFDPKNGEIHIFYENGVQKAVHITDDGNDASFPPIDRSYLLLPEFGDILTVRQYVAFDADGQAYIQAVRLLDLEG